MAVCCLEDFQVSARVNRVRKEPGLIWVYCLLYMGNLIECCRSTIKGQRETHSPPRHDIVFDLAKCWAQQQALTRRRSPLKEGCTQRMAGGPFFKVKVVSSHCVKLLWLLLDINLLRFSFSMFFLLYFIFVLCFSINIKISLRYKLFSFCLEFLFKGLSLKKNCINFNPTVRTNQSKSLMLFLWFVVWIGELIPKTQQRFVFLFLD